MDTSLALLHRQYELYTKTREVLTMGLFIQIHNQGLYKH